MTIYLDRYLFHGLLERKKIRSEVVFELHSGSRLRNLYAINVIDISPLNRREKVCVGRGGGLETHWSDTYRIAGYLTDIPESEIFTVPATREDRGVVPVLDRDHDGFRVLSGTPRDTGNVQTTSVLGLAVCMRGDSTLIVVWCTVRGEASAV